MYFVSIHQVFYVLCAKQIILKNVELFSLKVQSIVAQTLNGPPQFKNKPLNTFGLTNPTFSNLNNPTHDKH